MSIIKGKNNVVAGFGGTKRCIGEVYFSQSSLATDNPGALPGWTGDYYENGKTLFPDLYNFVKAHSELQVTKTEYDNAIATYGECPKYVVDENSETSISTETATGYSITIQDVSSTSTSTQGIAKAPPITTADILLTQTPKVGDFIYTSVPTTTPVVNPADLESGYKCEITGVTYTEAGILATIAWSNDGATYGPYKVTEISEISITNFPITVSGTSLRLPKWQTAGRYLVKKEVNGNNWYALYSDGWLEQGGRYETNVHIENITFFKPFASVPLVLTSVQSTSRTSYNDFGIDVYNLTTTGFTKQDLRAVGMGWGWEAKGYAAGTPMENIKYPWISAYTSAVPASTAQAAEFTGALSGKANADLSNCPAGYDYVVDSYYGADGWWEKYKSGKVRQGGVYKGAFTSSTVHNLLKPFADTNYTIIGNAKSTSANTTVAWCADTLTTTTFTGEGFRGTAANYAYGTLFWIAEGMGA